MASINHPLSIPTVKAFVWSIVKKSQQPNCFNTETGPGDKWYNNLKKRNDLTENPTVLIVADPRWLILQFMNNTLLCWKKSSMIWSWQRSLNIFLIVTSPWWLFYFMLFYVILLFYVFIDQSFIPKTKHIWGQKLLILDGHGSHLDINTIQLCKANKIHLYCLPPHTTHISTPWCGNIPPS